MPKGASRTTPAENKELAARLNSGPKEFTRSPMPVNAVSSLILEPHLLKESKRRWHRPGRRRHELLDDLSVPCDIPKEVPISHIGSLLDLTRQPEVDNSPSSLQSGRSGGNMRWGGAGGGGTLSTPCKTQGEDESQRTEEISHCKPQFGLRSIMLAVPYANSERFEAAPVAHAIGTPPPNVHSLMLFDVVTPVGRSH